MVKFVNLETGNVFDGSSPYIFWIDGEQSTNILYTQKICFISDNENIEVELPTNEIFTLLSPYNLSNYTKVVDINELKVPGGKLISKGTLYKGLYVHMIYILCQSGVPGEYIEELYIDNIGTRIGADFYMENESLYINLSNNGKELPVSIQKALYPSHIQEDKVDNILMNRKLKELLSNYWDILANKGSYKSLYNSLAWFEYGDLMDICEVWKRYDKSGESYQIQDIQKMMNDNFNNFLENRAKTTHMAIYLALEKLTGEYDSELNPVLEKVAYKWSNEELSLKLSLLSLFYQTYFMPIHLDLIHATIEDIVFTNTFKNITTPIGTRDDRIYYSEDIKCNIKNNDEFVLGIVETYVGPNTIFGNQGNDDIIGIEKTPNVFNDTPSDDQLKDYSNKLYKGCGAIVDFEIELPISKNDSIKHSEIIIIGNNKEIGTHDYSILPGKFNFSLLFQYEGEYVIYLRSDSMNGCSFVKRFKINILDNKHCYLEVFKIKSIEGELPNPFEVKSKINKYMFGRYPFQPSIYTNYIPLGQVKLNHLLITTRGIPPELNQYYYSMLLRKGETQYQINISKSFDYQPDQNIINGLNNRNYIYRNDYIFVPEFHYLEKVDTHPYQPKLDDFIIPGNQALCVIPTIPYGRDIDDIEWEFINESAGTTIKTQGTIREPFIADSGTNPLPKGCYDILLRYRLGTQMNEVKLNSAFILI